MLKDIKKITGIMLIVASLAAFADPVDTSTTPGNTPDTSTATEQKTDASTSSTDKKADTTPATETSDVTTDEKDKKDTIHVTVSIDATANAAGIGFSVDGKETGGAGSSYTGVGPANKEYSFGYRKGLKTSENISCGTLTLTKDSKVTLVADGASCHSSVE